MRSVYCTCALLLTLVGAAPAQQEPPPGPPPTAYAVFLRGMPLGREDVTVRTDQTGTTVTSQTRLGPPFNLTLRRVEFKYLPDGTPISFESEGTVNGGDVAIRTTFKDGTAVSEGTQAGAPIAATHPVAPQTIVLPNLIYGGYAALARRLESASSGTEFKVYVLPVAEISGRVAAVHRERMQVGAAVFDVRRYELVFANPGGDLPVNLTTTEEGGLLRVNVPSAGLDVVRDDVAASTSRTQVYSHPGDEAATIPVVGFNLAATVTRPTSAAGRLPAVVLMSGAGVGDRDGFGLGIPIFGQLAGALADAGFMVVRYDKRGFGQSGGRAESATLSDHSEDARAVVKWLGARDDVDRDRVALLGHGEGAWAALLAASRERRRVSAVIAIATAGTTGGELLLEQQQHALEQLNLPVSEREERIALQKQIHAAVLTGKGWENIPVGTRKQADTPWFQSLLLFDPAKVADDVRQPMLIIHGELDKEIGVAHADRLADIVREEGKSPSVELLIVRGVNHLLVPATTGEVSEYAALQDRTVSTDITSAVSSWLTRTWADRR